MKPFLNLLLVFICTLSTAFSAIQAGQTVVVKIMGVPAEQAAQIDASYPISDEGLINLPFVGRMKAEGLEAGQLAMKIQKGYRDGEIFNDAVIQVVANDRQGDVVEEVVHVGGQVATPGPRAFRKGLTVFQAVQAAGGANEFGAMNRVKLYRDGKSQTIDLKDDAGKAVVTRPDDTIEVPQKNFFNK